MYKYELTHWILTEDSPGPDQIIGFHLPSEPHGCFSNWAHSEFVYAGVQYSCAEQYMMAQKVAMGHRYDLYQEIMAAHDPAKMKDLAGKDSFPEFVKIKDAWDRNCRHIVKRGVKAKFMQNLSMLQELLDTGNALLAECAGQDTVWSIGINLHSPAWHDVRNWRGNNYLGIILMEIRDELRAELNEKGYVQYLDFRDAPTITEWNMRPVQLKRVPQYFAAVHAYADQLQSQNQRDAFHNATLAEIDYAMATNMGGGLPIAGFRELRQEIYEIARRLMHTHYVSEVFGEDPPQWGLRGDPWFWRDLASAFAFDDLSMTPEELAAKIARLFEEKTGKPLTEDAQCYVKEYAHGGMSSGGLSGQWWVTDGIPLLQGRLRSMKTKT